MELIQTRYHSRFPFALWDRLAGRIHPNLFIRGKKQDFGIDDTLSEDEEIYWLIPMAGG